MVPMKPRGGVIAAPVSSPTARRHVLGPTWVPADNTDPGASPLITTAAFAPASAAETVNLAASSACCGVTAPTVSCRDTARDDAASRDFCSFDCSTIAFAATGDANAGSTAWGG